MPAWDSRDTRLNRVRALHFPPHVGLTSSGWQSAVAQRPMRAKEWAFLRPVRARHASCSGAAGVPLTTRTDLEYQRSSATLKRLFSTPTSLVLLSLSLALPTLGGGFLTDDHRFLALSAQRGSRFAPELFDFASGDVARNLESIARGRLPWWTAPDFRLHLWRPLTGALFAAQYRLFGTHAWGYHLCSLGLLAILLVLTQRLFREILPPRARLWAFAVFALRVHPDAYGWIAAQHVLLGACWVVAAILARVEQRASGRSPWLVTARLALGLLASESAVCGIAFVLAYELSEAITAAHGGSTRTTRARIIEVGRRFATQSFRTLLLAVAYFACYHAGHWGSRGSGFYRDPVAAPLAFLRVAPARLLVLFADLWLGVPAELGVSTHRSVAAAAGLCSILVVALVLWANRAWLTHTERATLVWLAPATFVALCVACAGVPSGRVRTLPGLGSAALVGVLLRVSLARRGTGIRAVAIGFGLVQCLLAPLGSLLVQRHLEHRARAFERIGRGFVSALGTSRTAFIVASDPIVFASQNAVPRAEAPNITACVSVASAARGAHRVTRTGPRRLLFEALDAPLLDGSFDSMVRDESRPLTLGARVRQCGADFVVARIRRDKPSAVSLELEHDADDAGLAFFAWDGRALARFAPPALGQSRTLPWFPGPSLIY